MQAYEIHAIKLIFPTQSTTSVRASYINPTQLS